MSLVDHNSEHFSQASVKPLRFEDDERRKTAMSEAMEIVPLISEEGQLFSGLRMNRDFEKNKPLLVVPGAFLDAVTGYERKYQAYQYAVAFPENPVVLIDQPAHGRSDPATPKQRREVLRHRSFEPIAQAEAQAVCNRYRNTSELLIVGSSAGGQVAPDLARHAGSLGMKPRLMVGYDISGVDKRPSPGIMKAFYWDEWRGQKRYQKNPDGARLRKAYEETFKADIDAAGYDKKDHNPYGIYKKDLRLVASAMARSPLASDNSFASIERVLDVYPDMTAALVSGAMSKVSRWRQIQPSIKALLERHPEQITWDVWEDDSHSIGLAPQQPRLASFARTVFDERCNNESE